MLFPSINRQIPFSSSRIRDGDRMYIKWYWWWNAFQNLFCEYFQKNKKVTGWNRCLCPFNERYWMNRGMKRFYAQKRIGKWKPFDVEFLSLSERFGLKIRAIKFGKDFCSFICGYWLKKWRFKQLLPFE